MAPDQFAAWNQGQALAPLCRSSRAGSRRTASGYPRYGRPSIYQETKSGSSGNTESTRERKYDLSNLPAGTPIKQLAAAIKARWVLEQAHQQLKEELGLDHFEGRSWKDPHRHALMPMIALALLQSLRHKQAKGGKNNLRTTPETEPASDQASHH